MNKAVLVFGDAGGNVCCIVFTEAMGSSLFGSQNAKSGKTAGVNVAGDSVPQWRTVYKLLLIAPSFESSSYSPCHFPIWGTASPGTDFPMTLTGTYILLHFKFIPNKIRSPFWHNFYKLKILRVLETWDIPSLDLTAQYNSKSQLLDNYFSFSQSDQDGYRFPNF